MPQCGLVTWCLRDSPFLVTDEGFIIVECEEEASLVRGLGRGWLHPACIPAQVEGQTDHIGPDEGYAESCVGGKVDHGDAREHATEAGDQPDRPHGDASHGRSIPSSLREPPGEIRSHFRW